MEKYRIEQLIIEVTKDCNMHCPHCLRGDIPENTTKMMDKDTIVNVLNKIQYIGEITFTGGEPTLNLYLISFILDYVKISNIHVDSFYLVTNGKLDIKTTNEFLTIMDNWFTYTMKCRLENTDELSTQAFNTTLNYELEEYYAGIALSVDDYHESIPKEVLIRLKSRSYYKQDKERKDDNFIMKRGRATTLVDTIQPKLLKEPYIDTDNNEIEQLYICTNGDIIVDCDYSYDIQNKLKLENVNNEDWLENLINKFSE